VIEASWLALADSLTYPLVVAGSPVDAFVSLPA
jgi:hypothetical protein